MIDFNDIFKLEEKEDLKEDYYIIETIILYKRIKNIKYILKFKNDNFLYMSNKFVEDIFLNKQLPDKPFLIKLGPMKTHKNKHKYIYFQIIKFDI